MPPPVCIKFYIQSPLSLVFIFSYVPPLIFQPSPPPPLPGNYCTVPYICISGASVNRPHVLVVRRHLFNGQR